MVMLFIRRVGRGRNLLGFEAGDYLDWEWLWYRLLKL